jgi:hypothetical protein
MVAGAFQVIMIRLNAVPLHPRKTKTWLKCVVYLMGYDDRHMRPKQGRVAM